MTVISDQMEELKNPRLKSFCSADRSLKDWQLVGNVSALHCPPQVTMLGAATLGDPQRRGTGSLDSGTDDEDWRRLGAFLGCT